MTRALLVVVVALLASTRAAEYGTWTPGAAAPTERAEVGAAALLGKIYVFGAYSGDSTAAEAYDPATDTWQPLPPLPRALNHTCAASVGATVYMIGGFDPTNANRPVDTTYAFNPYANTWSQVAPMPTPRGALACVTVGSVIFAIGGTSPAGDTGANEAYDAITDTWHPDMAPLPTPRDHLAAAVIEHRLIHVVGGRSPALGMTGNTHEVYDAFGNTWFHLAPMPTGRSGLGAAVLGGRIHVIGGEADRTFDENEAYDPSNDTWYTAAPLPTPRHGLGVVTVGDAIYVLAGGERPGDSRSNLVEIFHLE